MISVFHQAPDPSDLACQSDQGLLPLRRDGQREGVDGVGVPGVDGADAVQGVHQPDLVGISQFGGHAGALGDLDTAVDREPPEELRGDGREDRQGGRRRR